MSEKDKVYTEAGLKRTSVPNLLKIAKDKFGLDVDPNEEKAVVIDEILARQAAQAEAGETQVQSSEEIMEETTESASTEAISSAANNAPPEELDEAAAPEEVPVAAKEPKRIRVLFFKQPGDKENEDIKLSVNGRMYQVKKGVEVALPPEVVEVAKNAVETHFDRDDKGAIRETEVQRFPFQVLGEGG